MGQDLGREASVHIKCKPSCSVEQEDDTVAEFPCDMISTPRQELECVSNMVVERMGLPRRSSRSGEAGVAAGPSPYAARLKRRFSAGKPLKLSTTSLDTVKCVIEARHDMLEKTWMDIELYEMDVDINYENPPPVAPPSSTTGATEWLNTIRQGLRADSLDKWDLGEDSGAIWQERRFSTAGVANCGPGTALHDGSPLMLRGNTPFEKSYMDKIEQDDFIFSPEGTELLQISDDGFEYI